MLAQQVPAGGPDQTTWDAIAQQVPALLLFVAFAWIVFKYLDRKEERSRAQLDALAKTIAERDAARDAAFLRGLETQQASCREERETYQQTARQFAAECHAKQGEAVSAMRELAAASARLAPALDSLNGLAGRIERALDRAAA